MLIGCALAERRIESLDTTVQGSVAVYAAHCLWEPLGAEADGFYIMNGPPGTGRAA